MSHWVFIATHSTPFRWELRQVVGSITQFCTVNTHIAASSHGRSKSGVGKPTLRSLKFCCRILEICEVVCSKHYFVNQMVYKVCHTLCVVPRTLYDVKYNVQYTHCTTYSTNSFSSNIVRSKYPKYVCYTVCVVPRTVQTPPLPIYWSYLVMSKYSYFVCHTVCV